MTHRQHPEEPRVRTEALEDVESDPALSDKKGFDWTDEGGATLLGPATQTPQDPAIEPPRPKPGPPKKRML